MKEVDVLISGIDRKIRKLIGTLDALKAENALLKEKQTELKTIIEQQSDKIRSFVTKLDQVAVSHSFENSDIDLARKKIGGLVEEIDKCIGLLNK